MIVSFSPSTNKYPQSKTSFGDAYSANLLVTTYTKAMNTTAKELRLSPVEVLVKLQQAIRNEDKAGKSVLRKLQDEILANLT